MTKYIIKKILLLNAVFCFLMIVYRVIFVICYGQSDTLKANLIYLVKAFFVGSVYDAVVLGYINIPVFMVFAILFLIAENNKVFLKFLNNLKYYYSISFSFIILILCVDFGFYYFYRTHINIVIFNGFDYKLSYLWYISQNEHFLFFILFLLFVLCVISIFFVSKYILEKKILNYYLQNIRIWTRILLPVCLITLIFQLLSFGTGVKSYENKISSNFPVTIKSNFFIHIALNPVFALYDAINCRMKKTDYIFEYGYENNIRKAFSDWLNIDISNIDKKNPEKSLLKITKYNKHIELMEPNVILIVMESLDSNVMLYHTDSLNLLGEFKKHLDEDIVFYNCLYSYNNSFSSLNTIMLNLILLPSMNKPGNEYEVHALDKKITFGLNTYKKNNYLTIYIYPKITSVTKLSNFKFDIYNSKNIRNDEDVFESIFRQLEINDKKKFIYALTISNHHPFAVPGNYTPLPLNVPDRFKNKTKYKNLIGYQYSCQKVGEFLTKFKKSKYADNTIIAITGDHGSRGGIFNSGISFNKVTVPLYIYMPKKIMPEKKNINTSKVISHMDIMPTLYELSLSNATYYSMGNNILNKNKYIAVAQDYSEALITDSEYAYKTKKNLCFVNEYHNNIFKMFPCEIRLKHENIVKKYKAGMAISQYILEDLSEKH